MKTRSIFEIAKGTFLDPKAPVNKRLSPEKLKFPFSNMIYIGDGPTDIPHKIESYFPSRLEEGVFMVIRSRTGKSVENISNSLTEQKEVIFSPGSRFIVEAVQKRPDGSHIVYLDEIF